MLLPLPPLLLLVLLLLTPFSSSVRTVPVNCISPLMFSAVSTCERAAGSFVNDLSQCCDPKLAVRSLGYSSDDAVILLRRGYSYNFVGSHTMFSETVAFSKIEIRGSGTSSEVQLYSEDTMGSFIDDPYYSTIDGSNFNDDTRGITWG
jgi:hypothetical protein